MTEQEGGMQYASYDPGRNDEMKTQHINNCVALEMVRADLDITANGAIEFWPVPNEHI